MAAALALCSAITDLDLRERKGKKTNKFYRCANARSMTLPLNNSLLEKTTKSTARNALAGSGASLTRTTLGNERAGARVFIANAFLACGAGTINLRRRDASEEAADALAGEREALGSQAAAAVKAHISGSAASTEAVGLAGLAGEAQVVAA